MKSLAWFVPVLGSLLGACQSFEDCTSEGCECHSDARPIVCYEAPLETAGQGPCVAGVRSCVGGFWTGCEGQVLPEAEVCDDVDNDCDGTPEDGLITECGTCGEPCEVVTLGDDTTPWSGGKLGRGVSESAGSLTFDEASLPPSVVWVPYAQGVTKVDGDTHEPVARYLTHPGGTIYTLSTNASMDAAVTGWAYRGTSYLDGSDTTVVRIDASDCPEGATSETADDYLEFGEDACVRWSTPLVPASSSDAYYYTSDVVWETRSALDAPEELLWVSTTDGIVELTADGEITGRVVPIVSPSLVLRDGVLWAGDGSSISTIDPASATIVGRFSHPDLHYATCLTFDPEGRLWGSGALSAFVLDPASKEFEFIALGARSLAISADSAWIAGTDGLIYEVDLGTRSVEGFDYPEYEGAFFGPTATFAVDHDETVWLMPESWCGADFPLHTFEPDDVRDYEELESLRLTTTNTCSDLTGTRDTPHTTRDGTARYLFEPCEGTTSWRRLFHEVETPPGAWVGYRIRSAAERAWLSSAPWASLGRVGETTSSSFSIEGAAAWVEVEVEFLPNDEELAPSVSEIGLSRVCDEEEPAGKDREPLFD